MGNDAEEIHLYYEGQTDNYNQTHYQLLVSHTFTPSLNLDGALYCTKGKKVTMKNINVLQSCRIWTNTFVYQGLL